MVSCRIISILLSLWRFVNNYSIDQVLYILHTQRPQVNNNNFVESWWYFLSFHFFLIRRIYALFYNFIDFSEHFIILIRWNESVWNVSKWNTYRFSIIFKVCRIHAQTHTYTHTEIKQDNWSNGIQWNGCVHLWQGCLTN